MPGAFWTDAEVAAARELEWSEFHKQYPERPWEGYRYKRRMIRDGKVAPQIETVADEADPEALFEATVALQQQLKLISSALDDVTCTLDVSHPVGIAFLSDAHIGEIGSDLLQLKQDIEEIADHEALYVYLGGDMAHNFILSAMSHFGTMDDSAVPPRAQQVLLDWLVGKLHGSTIAMSTGNHDWWSRRQTDIDSMQALAKRHNIVYTGHGGMVRLKVGSQTYRIYRRHKYRYNSSFNLCHVVKQMWRMGGVDFDVGVVEHGHQPAIETFTEHGQPRLAIRTGTYLTESGFAAEVGAQWTHGVPVVVFHADEFRMVPFSGLAEACTYLG